MTKWIKSFAITLVLLTPALIEGCKLPMGGSIGPVGESYIHVRPSWSPDGSLIAYNAVVVDGQGIYLVDTMGTNSRKVLTGEGTGVTWSPDGAQLAFSRVQVIYTLTLSDGILEAIVPTAGVIRPSWSRDGNRLTFVRTSPATSRGIWVYDFRTKATTHLLSYGDYPSWHPNGGEIVFLETRYEAALGAFVYSFSAVNVESAITRTIHSFTSSGDCGFTSIGPTAGAILYSLRPLNEFAQVWVFNLSTRQHTRLTDDGGDFPAWSPNGSRIVYTRTAPGDGGLWIMNSDGSSKRRLTKP